MEKVLFRFYLHNNHKQINFSYNKSTKMPYQLLSMLSVLCSPQCWYTLTWHNRCVVKCHTQQPHSQCIVYTQPDTSLMKAPLSIQSRYPTHNTICSPSSGSHLCWYLKEADIIISIRYLFISGSIMATTRYILIPSTTLMYTTKYIQNSFGECGLLDSSFGIHFKIIVQCMKSCFCGLL